MSEDLKEKQHHYQQQQHPVRRSDRQPVDGEESVDSLFLPNDRTFLESSSSAKKMLDQVHEGTVSLFPKYTVQCPYKRQHQSPADG